MSDPLRLELPAVLRCLPWGLGTEPHCSASVALALNCCAVSLAAVPAFSGCWDSNSGPYTCTAHTAEHLYSPGLGFDIGPHDEEHQVREEYG